MPDTQNTNSNIEQIVTKLATRFQPEQAKDMHVVYQFRLIDSFSFFLQIANQQCTTEIAEHDDPNIILTMKTDIFIALMAKEIDGMSAYLKGDLKAQGNIMLATQLSKLFKKKAGDHDKLSDTLDE